MASTTRKIIRLESQLDSARQEIARLTAENSRILAENLRLSDENAELRRRVGQSSANSSMPPSSDPPWTRRPSRRAQSGRKPGGQLGHPGSTLVQSPTHDKEVFHDPGECGGCGHSLSLEPLAGTSEVRQVFDLPEDIRMRVTAHIARSKRCPQCGKAAKGVFPPGVDAPAQYGVNVKCAAVCLSAHHHMPAERTAEALSDLTGSKLSPGTVMSFVAEAARRAAPAMDKVKDAIAASAHAHFDETGCKLGKAKAWMHVAATKDMADFHFSLSRGIEGMDDFGILPRFGGFASHDFWKAYHSYPGLKGHNPCRAHLVRELLSLAENAPEQAWAVEMRRLLVKGKEAADEARTRGMRALPILAAEAMAAEYREILRRAMEANNLKAEDLRRGSLETKAATRAKNLIKRLVDYESGVLLHIRDLSIPFDNNEAERAIRPFKIKMKVSGCFRSAWGAKACAVLRGYIWTARKNAVGAFDALRMAFAGNPHVPEAARIHPA